VLPTVKVPFGGLYGQPQEYTVVNEPFGEDPGGKPGKYKIVFTLAKPGVPLRESNDVNFDPNLMGDSYITLPRDNSSEGGATESDRSPSATPVFQQLMIRGSTPDGSFEFRGHPNKFGRLGRIECEVAANSFRDAKQKTFRALASALSSWSAQLDIPIDVGRTHITEIATTTTQVDWTAPYPHVPLALRSEAQLDNELRGYASLYREAMNSNSAVYRFLCFFKVIEGIRARRKRIDRASKAQGSPPPTRPPEAIPAQEADFSPWLNRIYHVRREWDPMALESIFLPQVRGQGFEWIYENKLNPLRIDVAHGLFEKDELTLSADELLHAHRVEEWLPLTKCMARRMLKNEFPDQFLAFVGEDGVINP